MPEMNETDHTIGKGDATMDVAHRSTVATKTIIRSVLGLLLGQKLLTSETHTPQFDAAVKELVRDIETVVRTNLLSYGYEIEEQSGAADKSGASGPKKQESGNRTKFLLRLIAGRFSHLFANPTGTSILPREVVMGFDDYMMKLLGEVLYEELNAEAGELLSWFDTDDDGLIWKEIGENDRYKRFAYNILIRILLKYEDFDWARKNFISVVNNVTERKSGFIFEDQHFQLLFNALFTEIFKDMWDDEESIKLDFMFGSGTVATIEAIREEFKAYRIKWKRSQAKPDENQ